MHLLPPMTFILVKYFRARLESTTVELLTELHSKWMLSNFILGWSWWVVTRTLTGDTKILLTIIKLFTTVINTDVIITIVKSFIVQVQRGVRFNLDPDDLLKTSSFHSNEPQWSQFLKKWNLKKNDKLIQIFCFVLCLHLFQCLCPML